MAGLAESTSMDDDTRMKPRKHVLVVYCRDGTRELKTPRPLDSMDAAFEAIAQMARLR